MWCGFACVSFIKGWLPGGYQTGGKDLKWWRVGACPAVGAADRREGVGPGRHVGPGVVSRRWGEIPCRASHGWVGGSVGSGVGSPCGPRDPPACGIEWWRSHWETIEHVAPVGASAQGVCEKKWGGARSNDSNDVVDKELTVKNVGLVVYW
jgi:hypothetical protein